MRLTAESGEHSIPMDAKPPIGQGLAPTPKELLLAAVCGCTAMDVVALLKKYKQPLEALEIEAEASVREGKHPAVFNSINLKFKAKGALEREKLLEAVHLSQTRYCTVSAMLSRAVQIHYEVELNAENVGAGDADFSAALES